VDWQAGDAVYIPVWAWHHHANLDDKIPASYLACENAPMLQNMGRLAIREEAQ
jgi:gentisate 1,2-dioxygenase